MMGTAELRNSERELQQFQLRIGVAGIAMLVAFVILLGRFFFLQVIQHEHYASKAEDNRISIVPIPPNRGLITDRNGVLLGQHALAYSIVAFLGIWLSRRILWFGTGLQAMHVGAILLVGQAVALLVRVVAGDSFPGWAMLVGPIAGAILWPVVSWLLLIPQRRAEREQTI